MKKLFLATIAFASLTTNASTLIFKISANLDSLYSQSGKDTFIKEYSNFSGKMELSVKDGELNLNNTIDMPSEREKSIGLKSLTVLKNGFAQFVDKQTDEQGNKSNIDTKVKVDLRKKGLFGKLTGLSVSSSDLEALYADDIKKRGLDQLKNFTTSTEELNISTSVTFSDMDCEIQGGGMQCLETFELVVKASDE